MKRADLLAFLRANPGADSTKISTHFGENLTHTSANLCGNHKRGHVTRNEVRRLPSGVPVYGYFAVEGTEGLNKPERLAKVRSVRVRTEPSQSFDFTHSINALAEGLAKQIAAQVVVALQGQLTRELAGVVPPAVEIPKIDIQQMLPGPVQYIPAPAPKQRKPKVAIIGVTPQQAGVLQTEFHDTIDLSFWQNDGVPRLKSIGISNELCLVTRFVGHKDTQMLTAIGAKWRKVTGGIESLRDALTNYYVQEAA